MLWLRFDRQCVTLLGRRERKRSLRHRRLVPQSMMARCTLSDRLESSFEFAQRPLTEAAYPRPGISI